ncbi:hypothetical protein [Echinicola shivajiensis]|uniref:hypothetical protein n=1 Tax=Echinicola shivajiensis TaxID=1035916 RepID=UPI001BFC65C5|nr:hypothetical protein [Echinicola shivajiensis]
MRNYLIYALGLMTVGYFSYQYPLFSYALLSLMAILFVYILLAGIVQLFRKHLDGKWFYFPLAIFSIPIFGLLIGLLRPLPDAIIPSDDVSKKLEYAYSTDQGDRKNLKFFLPTYRAQMIKRDSIRLVQVRDLKERGKINKSMDKFHAAFVLHHNHIKDSALYRMAHTLAHEADADNAMEGNLQVEWLKKATYDRWMLSIGKAQKYNTQGGISFEVQ